MNEADIRKCFSDLFESNKEIERIYKRIRNGKADYNDANKFAIELGRLIEKAFDAHAPDTIEETTAYIIENMLQQNVRLVSLVCEAVQNNLNTAEGVGLNAVTPYEPKISSRISGTIKAVQDVPETASALVMLNENAKTLTLAVVDEWVKANADFQAKAGLNPVIVRKWDGVTGSHDTRHTDWCSKLEGTFVYGEEPKDVYKRHKGCQCIVAYYPSKEARGRMTALSKGETDTGKDLWNTGQVFSNSRSAILRRRRNQYGKEEARKILNEEWRGGMNGNAERHFT